MLSKRTTSIIGTFAAIIIMAMLVGLGYAKLKSEESGSGSYVPEQALEDDSYGKVPVLIDVLSYSGSGEVLGAEIGLNKKQAEQVVKIAHEEEDQSRELRWTRGLGVEEFNQRVYALMKASDEKLKRILNPLQYVKFRDWIVEELILERNSMRKERKELLLEVKPITFYTMIFFQTQLELSKKEAEAIKQLIYQTKEETLPLREKWVDVIEDPQANELKKEKTTEQIIKQIQPQAQKLESDILKTLPLSKRKLYASLTDAPVEK